MADQVVARTQDEGVAYWLLGGLYEVKAAGSETGGAVTVVEVTLPPGSGPPPHTHAGGESVYVLSGKIAYHIGDDRFEGGPGAFFYIPEGVWENFEPLEESRLLVIYMPGGQEEFFAEAGEPAGERKLPPALDAPPDVGRLIAIAERYGMHMKPPATV
jgi:quercetin dioxygenase-like cupin family protein